MADDNGGVPAPTDAAVSGTADAAASNDAPAPALAPVAESDKSVDQQLADLQAAVASLQAAVVPPAPAPGADETAETSEIGNLHAAVARLYKHIFGETF